ncbi:MAG TPA: hypothetical protein PK957_02530 [Candidatus Dojkabacteria bacterium]|nr:hypothetical protein [Candidatus Dojkabacteria bacterium]
MSTTLSIVITILFAFLVSFMIAPVVIRLLYFLKIRQQGKQEVDSYIKDRSISKGTPIMGGIIIIISFLVTYYWVGLNRTLGYILPVVIVVSTSIGFLTDYLDLFGKKESIYGRVKSSYNKLIYHNFTTWRLYRIFTTPIRIIANPINSVASFNTGISPALKLGLMTIVTTVFSYLIFKYSGNTKVIIPFVTSLELGKWIIPFNSLLMLGFSNAFCWADGLDGMSAGNHFIIFIFSGIIAYLIGNTEIALLSFAIAGAELTFYYFNIPPARVEMSDIGTIPLGILFGYVFISLNQHLLSVIVGIFFVIEVLSSVIQPLWLKLFKRQLFQMAPIHHHFEMLGWSKEKIVMRSYFLSIIAGLIGLLVVLL